MNPKLTPIAVIIAGLLLGAAAAVVVERWVIHNTGTITIDTYLTAYVDSDIHVNGTSITWGALDRGATYYVNLTVVNTSPVAVTVYVTNDTMPTYLSSTWTADNTLLAPGAAAKGDFELTVASDAPQGASFDFTSFVTADA